MLGCDVIWCHHERGLLLQDGWCPLLYAAKEGHTEVVRCLLERELASIKQASRDQEASTQQEQLNPILSCILITSKVWCTTGLLCSIKPGAYSSYTPDKTDCLLLLSCHHCHMPLHHYDVIIVHALSMFTAFCFLFSTEEAECLAHSCTWEETWLPQGAPPVHATSLTRDR